MNITNGIWHAPFCHVSRNINYVSIIVLPDALQLFQLHLMQLASYSSSVFYLAGDSLMALALANNSMSASATPHFAMLRQLRGTYGSTCQTSKERSSIANVALPGHL
mmetsp:Transcript_138170/g.240372  ORF Transcript_138170/g.240372 Transcript_138170/m.240372 type:complete len:107 (+) Transcript_138170:1060-1380(+)